MNKKNIMTDYYNSNYEEFYEKTVSVDPSSFLTPFINHLLPGASVLDVGCGSGRDLLWLKKRGFRPTGFEKSEGLAKLARKHSGCDVIEGDFETYDFLSLSFDAVVLSGSLVHVPHEKLPVVFRNIVNALRHKGVHVHGMSCTLCYSGNYVYASFKKGKGTKTDAKGRRFYLWHDGDLRKIFADSGFSVLNFSESKSVVNSKDLWLGYVLIKE